MQDRTTQYAADVLAGKIIAGNLVKLACKRHLDDIEKSKAAPYKYYFDVEQAERIIEFAETLTIAEGEEEVASTHFDQVIAGHRFEALQCFGKVILHMNAVLGAEVRKVQFELADELHDQLTADVVVFAHAQAALDGQLVGVDSCLVGLHLLDVLAGAAGHLADG